MFNLVIMNTPNKNDNTAVLIFVALFFICCCCCSSSVISGGGLFLKSDKKDKPAASPPSDTSSPAASSPAVSSYFTEGVDYSIKGGRDGKYCANDDVGLICNRSAVAGWEKFQFIHQGDNIYAIKSMRSGKQCKDNRENVSKCDTDHIQGHEKFVFEKHGDKYSIKGGWGNKYCSDQSVGLVCNTDHLQDWEKFTITKA
jgi:hypothetical protein